MTTCFACFVCQNVAAYALSNMKNSMDSLDPFVVCICFCILGRHEMEKFAEKFKVNDIKRIRTRIVNLRRARIQEEAKLFTKNMDFIGATQLV